MDPIVVRCLYFCDSASPPCVIRDLAPLREAEPTFFLRGTNRILNLGVGLWGGPANSTDYYDY